MFTDLWKEVREQLLSHFAADRFKATHQGSRWEFQTVDLDDADFIVRIVHERGTYEVRFLSRAAPMKWYALNEVLTYLGLPRQPLMPPLEIAETLTELRRLLESQGESLRRAFDRNAYPATRESLPNTTSVRSRGLESEREASFVRRALSCKNSEARSRAFVVIRLRGLCMATVVNSPCA